MAAKRGGKGGEKELRGNGSEGSEYQRFPWSDCQQEQKAMRDPGKVRTIEAATAMAFNSKLSHGALAIAWLPDRFFLSALKAAHPIPEFPQFHSPPLILRYLTDSFCSESSTEFQKPHNFSHLTDSLQLSFRPLKFQQLLNCDSSCPTHRTDRKNTDQKKEFLVSVGGPSLLTIWWCSLNLGKSMDYQIVLLKNYWTFKYLTLIYRVFLVPSHHLMVLCQFKENLMVLKRIRQSLCQTFLVSLFPHPLVTRSG